MLQTTRVVLFALLLGCGTAILAEEKGHEGSIIDTGVALLIESILTEEGVETVQFTFSFTGSQIVLYYGTPDITIKCDKQEILEERIREIQAGDKEITREERMPLTCWVLKQINNEVRPVLEAIKKTVVFDLPLPEAGPESPVAP